MRKALLVCGILSSLLYVGTDILAALRTRATATPRRPSAYT